MKKLFRLDPEHHGGASSTGLSSSIMFAWQPRGNFLATVGKNSLVHVWDRHGERIEDGDVMLKGQGKVLCLEWDFSGETLAILQEGNGVVELWDIKTRSSTSLDTNLKDPSFLKWSAQGPELAIGTNKGNLLLYNSDNRRKVPVLGKHARRITCGAWSSRGKLALGSDDKFMTISDRDGNTEDQKELKNVALEMCFAMGKGGKGKRSRAETHLSVNMGSTLLLYDLSEPDNPLELAFQNKYGNIVKHCWFDDGHIMLGFSEGFLVVISTLLKEIGEELFSARYHHSTLRDISYSRQLKCAACAGDGGVKIVDFSKGFDMVQKPEEVKLEHGGISEKCTRTGWSPDGQILTVACTSGSIHGYLAKMQIVNASYKSQVAYLSSLKEVSVVDVRGGTSPMIVPLSIEAKFIALGETHVGAVLNSRVVFHRCLADDWSQVGNSAGEEYGGKVDAITLNNRFAAILAVGRVTLHEIEGVSGPKGLKTKVFPDNSSPVRGNLNNSSYISAIALTDTFLFMSSNSGAVEIFMLESWTSLEGAALHHSSSIVSLFPNATGTRVVLIDETGDAFVGNPVSGELTPFPLFPRNIVKVMWDSAPECSGLILVYDGNDIHTYMYAPSSVKGATISKLGSVEIGSRGEITVTPQAHPLPANCTPIVSFHGDITCQDNGGNLVLERVPQLKAPLDSAAALRFTFTSALMMLDMKTAWIAARQLNGRAYWYALSYKAMEIMDVRLASRVYRELGDAGMVMGLERLVDVEDVKLLAGHMALLYDDYAKAQDLFLSSSRPRSALEMRMDLLHWNEALKLAETLSPREVPEISVEYARQQEFKGEFSSALKMFEQALALLQDPNCKHPRRQALLSDSVGGVARCTLRCGDLRRGLRIVNETNNPTLCLECARILESMENVADTEAASLYEKGSQFDKAAAIYVKSAKNLPAASAIIHKVQTPKLLVEYAARCEKEGQFDEAAKAYDRANDSDSVVRLCLSNLNKPERAFDIVRSTSSSTGARLVAHYCKQEGNFRGAIEFLLLATCTDEAFQLAKEHECMEVFTKSLGDDIGSTQAASVASYYEGLNQLGNAGHFYSLCGQYARALKLFLQCGDKEVERAIEVVGKARNDMLTHTLIDFLMGDTDGVMKEAFHIYRLYLALGNYAQAAKTAVIISRQEQDLGNYKQAHSILFETIKQLEEHKVRVPQNLRRPFTLLHSYVLVLRSLNKRSDNLGAANLLLRVAESISKFPSHKVSILTSTVVACSKAGMKASALEYAMQLMRPEYRSHVDPKFKRKIEAMVRKPKDSAKEEEATPLTPCPISGLLIPDVSLECPTTKDAIPMCVVTGRHIIADDTCICPRSGMPAIYSQYIKYIEFDLKSGATESVDPVTLSPVTVQELIKCSKAEVDAVIANHNMSDVKEEGPESGSPNTKGKGSNSN